LLSFFEDERALACDLPKAKVEFMLSLFSKVSWMSPVVLMLAVDSSACCADTLLQDAIQVSVGGEHACAVVGDGTVDCWGNNEHGELGVPNDGAVGFSGKVSFKPVKVQAPLGNQGVLTRTIAVSAGWDFTCSLDLSAAAWCWGANTQGQLGAGVPDASSAIPLRVGIYEPIIEIAASDSYACALLNNAVHSVRCWGSNGEGQLANGDDKLLDRSIPADVVISEKDGTKRLLTGVQRIAAGGDRVCATMSDSSLACWGDNTQGALGNGDVVPFYPSPTAVVISEEDGSRVALLDVSSVTLGFRYTCAIIGGDLSAACFGDNEFAQYGISVPRYSYSPIRQSDERWIQLSAGGFNTCGIRESGNLACWGDNTVGQLGIGSLEAFGWPQTVPIETVTQVSVGWSSACAILKQSGEIKCWGFNGVGELGADLRIEQSSIPLNVVEPAP
jgi:alpha-tubulin suppressor-like RCC1 family protein